MFVKYYGDLCDGLNELGVRCFKDGTYQMFSTQGMPE